MNFTKEQYEYLQNFEPQFNTAIKSHFARMDNRDTLAKLDSIYQSVFHRSSNLLGGCNRCVVDGLTKLGTLYFKDKADYAQKNAMETIQPECATTTTLKEEKAVKPKRTTKNNKK